MVWFIVCPNPLVYVIANDTQQDGNVANEAEVKQHEDHEGDGGSRSSGVSTPTPATGIGGRSIVK